MWVEWLKIRNRPLIEMMGKTRLDPPEWANGLPSGFSVLYNVAISCYTERMIENLAII
jgi:hypothetical protein